jgi:RHH-type transcriptional regulator, proline utilization regulon repressor / proline dehydrogenase / delta 1-pyrroline-5-carboxylate dehydrogenase
MFLSARLCSKAMNSNWSLDYLQEFESLVLEEGAVSSQMQAYLEDCLKLASSNQSYRFQARLKSTPVMMNVFFDEKKIRLCSPRLSNELFLLTLIESEELKEKVLEEAGPEQVEQYEQLKLHVEKCATLDPRDFPSEYQSITLQHGLVDLLNEQDPKIQEKMNIYIIDILYHLNKYRPVLFERLSDIGLSLTAQYALLRIHLLKFLAILPSLDHDHKGHTVKKILLESLRRLLHDSSEAKRLKKKGQDRALSSNLIFLISVGHFIAQYIPAYLLTSLIRSSVRMMARRFIAGESIDEAQKSFQEIFASGRDVTLDQLGELVVSESEADHYRDEVLKLIHGFAQHITPGDCNLAGINRAHVSIKVSALCSDFKPEAPERTYASVAPRLKEILLAAKDRQVFLNIDAEHYHYRDIVLMIYSRILLETPELRDFKSTGIVLQAYLRDASLHLDDILKLARQRGLNMPIRLVKGAYWDAETVEAQAHSYNAPQFLNKEETDLMFRQMIHRILEHGEHIQLCLASHNFADHCYAQATRSVNFPDAPVIEHQCLHMTYEALSSSLGKMGWATRNYVPIGSLIVGMAYLVRRIMENSSQVGVLTIMRSHKKPASLEGPESVHHEKILTRALARDITQEQPTEKFFNVAPVRTYIEGERGFVEQSLQRFRRESMGLDYKNAFETSGDWVEIFSSSDEKLMVGRVRFATATDAQKALDIVDQSVSHWWCSNAPDSWLKRVSTLTRAANLMLARRNDLSALIMMEAGKVLGEALGDVDEAIDFLNFYAREEAKLQHRGEAHHRGPVAVISPWNFPLAIPCGMVSAALMAGNPVILKSAEQTPLIAQTLVDLLHEAGVPQSILIHLPGLGEQVGAPLVASPKIAGIIFTGSKTVGMMIANKAQSRLYHHPISKQSYPVKVITEMGGKNAIIVTSSAELDETVAGILSSAFGHAGQKCSAASRVIVHKAVIDRLKERLKLAVLDLRVGAAFEFSTDINPLIAQEDRDRVRNAAQEAGVEALNNGGEVVIDRSLEDGLPGFCVGPSVFLLPKKQALKEESWAQKEVFGPFLHLIPVGNLDEALEVFNSTEYALTGGIFSQSQDEIDYLQAGMQCGNLYVNRNITGARVAIEPFGGFKLSGTGPKAGSKSYMRSMHRFFGVEATSIKDLQVEGENLEQGSEYQFELARSSGLFAEGRVSRLSVALEQIINRYEVIFQGVDGDGKDLLTRFENWVANNLLGFSSKEHLNLKIPGQISHNDYSQMVGHVLVIADLKIPTVNTVVQVLSAIGMGSGVTITARHSEAYVWWSAFVDILWKAGFSRENLDVYFPSAQGIQKIMQDPNLELIILDGDHEMLETVPELYPSEVKVNYMRQWLTTMDLPFVGDFKSSCENFIHVRAMAINTMRHGAPMDVEA